MHSCLIEKNEIALILDRLAAQILEKHPSGRNLMLVGIERRGADIARRLNSLLIPRYGHDIPLGTLDINLYRDDWTTLATRPHIGMSEMPLSPDDRNILLVDDVLFSGRTVRAALEAILDYGRPKRVELLVFIDRGHRELPIQPDFTGRKIETRKEEHIDVFLEERDGKDAICLTGS